MLQLQRALTIFSAHGVASFSGSAGHQVLLLEFGSDAKLAAEMAVAIFNQIYRHRKPSFRIVESDIPEISGDLPNWKPTPNPIAMNAVDGYQKCPKCGININVTDSNAIRDNMHQRCKQTLVIEF